MRLDEVRSYFNKAKGPHRDPVGQPQEWFGIIISNTILRVWTADDQTAPPKGWIKDRWDKNDSQEVKDQYALILVLTGAINEELITHTDIPETIKPKRAALQDFRRYTALQACGWTLRRDL